MGQGQIESPYTTEQLRGMTYEEKLRAYRDAEANGARERTLVAVIAEKPPSDWGPVIGAAAGGIAFAAGILLAASFR